MYRLLVLLFIFVLAGCTNVQRLVHVYGGEAPTPAAFRFSDGGSSQYYSFVVGAQAQPDTAVFFYGGSGCTSWKSVLPGYVDGLAADARVFVLNKRFVSDRSTGMLGCSTQFRQADNLAQWVADYAEFVRAQTAVPRFRHVVLVGISQEGALSAAAVAARLPQVTHLAIIGAGGYSMRKSLSTLAQRGALSVDVDAGWEKISADPGNIDKSWNGNPYRWWTELMDIDPMANLSRLGIPVLVGIGEQDGSVPVESARFLAFAFKEAGKTNLRLQVYPGADHRLEAGGHSHRGEFLATLGCLLRAGNDMAQAQAAGCFVPSTKETKP